MIYEQPLILRNTNTNIREDNLPVKNKGITQERLKSLVYYTDEGNLRWKRAKGRAAHGAALGWKSGNGYVRTRVDNYETAVHRLIWLYHYGELPDKDVDHINGVRDDNRIENLRLASRSQNNMNYSKPVNNTSGIRGVYQDKVSGLWYWQVKYEGTVHSGLGFATPVEAGKERLIKAKELAGEFVHG